MALVKVYTKQENYKELFTEVARSVKLVAAAALDVPKISTNPGGIETVYIEGIDLVGIDYILEIVAIERPNQQHIAEEIIRGLNEVYPGKLFSVYFNNIHEAGMANTPRQSEQADQITMEQAIERSKE